MMTRARPMAMRRSRVQTRISWRRSWCEGVGGEDSGAAVCAGEGTEGKGDVVAAGESPAGEERMFSSGLSITYCLLFITRCTEIRPVASCKREGRSRLDSRCGGWG